MSLWFKILFVTRFLFEVSDWMEISKFFWICPLSSTIQSAKNVFIQQSTYKCAFIVLTLSYQLGMNSFSFFPYCRLLIFRSDIVLTVFETFTFIKWKGGEKKNNNNFTTNFILNISVKIKFVFKFKGTLENYNSP